MSVVISPTAAPPVTFAPVTVSPVLPPSYIYYPVATSVSYARNAPRNERPTTSFSPTFYSDDSWRDSFPFPTPTDSGEGSNSLYPIIGTVILLALIIASFHCGGQRAVDSEGGQEQEQPEQQEQQYSRGVESQATRPSATRPSATRPSATRPSAPSLTAALPSPAAAPPSLQDLRRAASLRAKVVQAIFPETVVDSKSLQYDAEANSVRWTNNKDADTTCTICIDRFRQGDTVIPSLCGHTFHRDCIVRWSQRKSECPVCRQDMWDTKTYEVLEKEIKAGACQYWL